jgi:hypothetical protein
MSAGAGKAASPLFDTAYFQEKMVAPDVRVDDVVSFQRHSRPAWWFSGRIMKRTNLGRFQLKLFDSSVFVWRRIDQRLPWHRRRSSVSAGGIPPAWLAAIGRLCE